MNCTPKDFSQRDADLVRVIPKLAKVLPDKAMNAMDDALSLNALSFDLDMAMAQYLQSHFPGEPINRDNYAWRIVMWAELRIEASNRHNSIWAINSPTL